MTQFLDQAYEIIDEAPSVRNAMQLITDLIQQDYQMYDNRDTFDAEHAEIINHWQTIILNDLTYGVDYVKQIADLGKPHALETEIAVQMLTQGTHQWYQWYNNHYELVAKVDLKRYLQTEFKRKIMDLNDTLDWPELSITDALNHELNLNTLS